MKVYIDEPINYYPNNIDELLHMKQILEDYSVFSVIENDGEEQILILNPQKICLMENEMNILFSDVIDYFQDISLQYFSDGAGCDFSLSVTQYH